MSESADTIEFTIRRKVFKLFGAAFHIYDNQERVIGFCKQKAFKLKEDLRIYTDESAQKESIRIGSRSIIDFGATYDVYESGSGAKIGVLKRHGLKSMIRDEWTVMTPSENPLGRILEDSAPKAIARRVVPFANLIPQVYECTNLTGNKCATLATHFNLFVYRLTVKINPSSSIPPLLVLASGILIAAIEGRQEQ